MPNLAPTEKVLRAFQTGKIDWRSYRAELRESTSTDRANRTIRNHGQKFTLRLLQHLTERETVTLLCHCAEDEPHATGIFSAVVAGQDLERGASVSHALHGVLGRCFIKHA